MLLCLVGLGLLLAGFDDCHCTIRFCDVVVSDWSLLECGHLRGAKVGFRGRLTSGSWFLVARALTLHDRAGLLVREPIPNLSLSLALLSKGHSGETM